MYVMYFPSFSFPSISPLITSVSLSPILSTKLKRWTLRRCSGWLRAGTALYFPSDCWSDKPSDSAGDNGGGRDFLDGRARLRPMPGNGCLSGVFEDHGLVWLWGGSHGE